MRARVRGLALCEDKLAVTIRQSSSAAGECQRLWINAEAGVHMAAPASNCDEKSRLDSDQRESLTCDCQLLVGGNNHDGNRGIIGRNGCGSRETLVVDLVIDAHTEGE